MPKYGSASTPEPDRAPLIWHLLFSPRISPAPCVEALACLSQCPTALYSATHPRPRGAHSNAVIHTHSMSANVKRLLKWFPPIVMMLWKKNPRCEEVERAVWHRLGSIGLWVVFLGKLHKLRPRGYRKWRATETLPGQRHITCKGPEVGSNRRSLTCLECRERWGGCGERLDV